MNGKGTDMNHGHCTESHPVETLSVCRAGRGVVAAGCLLALLSSASSAAEPAALPPDLTLDRAVAESVRANPELRSAVLKTAALKERPAQARGLPNPMFKYGGMDAASGGNFPNTAEKRFMLEQSFPAFGKRGLGEQVAQQEVVVAQREADARVRDVVLRVKETYFDLYGAQRSRALVRDEETVLVRLEKVAETKYAAGEGAQPDVLKAQSEMALRRQRLVELEADEAVLKEQLNTLMSRSPDAPLGRAVTTPAAADPAGADALLALADKARPEIQGAEAQVARYEADRRLRSREYLPDYRLGIEYRDFARDNDRLMFTVGLEIPLWRDQYRAGVAEAAAMTAAGTAALESVRRQVASDVAQARVRLLSASRVLDSYRSSLIPQAETRYKASEAAYRAGKVDFLDLLESERFWLDVRLMAAGAEANVGVQAARLERAVGTDLAASPAAASGAGTEGKN